MGLKMADDFEDDPIDAGPWPNEDPDDSEEPEDD
jgi:hypothetical protein